MDLLIKCIECSSVMRPVGGDFVCPECGHAAHLSGRDRTDESE